jgi:pimeloyl-ACP methyl ester carboxylesterase
LEDRTRNGSVELVYERLGPDQGEPLLLIIGAAVSMMLWPAGFLDALIAQGFQVTRFDNRDSGHSTHLDGVTPPSTFKVLRALGSKRKRKDMAVPYRLEDMVDDAVSVLDAVGWESAHFVGVSLGAAIAQMLCARHPQRVRSLVSISTAPPDFRMAPLSFKSIRLLTLVSRRPKNAEEFATRAIRFTKITGSPAYPTDEAEIRRNALAEYERFQGSGGNRRQGLALMASGNRLAMLKSLDVPTLVIHGDKDVLAPLKGSKLVAEAIPGARLLIIPGMGHDLPRALWPRFAEEIADLAFTDRDRKADTS